MPRSDKRRQIMRATEKLLRDRHIHELTLDEVARVARVGKGTIYLHFKDKDDLFFQTALAGFDNLSALLQESLPPGAPFTERLRAACERIIAYFEERRSLLRIIQLEEGRATAAPGRLRTSWLEKRGELMRTLAALLQDGIDRGVLQAGPPPELMANYLLGMLRTRVRDLASAPAEERAVDHLLTLFLCGTASDAGRAEVAAGRSSVPHPDRMKDR